MVDTLGFVKYVKHIKKLGHDRVFRELTKYNNKYPYFRSIIPKDLLTSFERKTKFRLSLNCVRKNVSKT